MKFHVEQVTLPPEMGTTQDDQPLFVLIPTGIREGFVRQIRDAGKAKDDARSANTVLLHQVRGWNFDDEDGTPLALVRELNPEVKALAELPKDVKAAVEHVIASCPIMFFGWLATRIVDAKPLSEGAKSF